MTEKNSNRLITSVILVAEGVVFFAVTQHLIVILFETGPLTVKALPYVGGILFASVAFFLMAYSTVLDIISGKTYEYPGD